MDLFLNYFRLFVSPIIRSRVYLSRGLVLASLFLGTVGSLSAEWKKEVQECGAEVCFVLQGEEETQYLGSLIWANEAVEGGKEMYYDRYFYEAISLIDENGSELHVYGPILEQTGLEWVETALDVTFAEYVEAKRGWDAAFAKKIRKGNVRYFSDQERGQTEVHWIDGALWQVGLDSENPEISLVPEGVYAFALGEEHLFITPKIKTTKGRIQHSSFLRGGPVRSAGKIQVGAEGQIVWLSNDSGHYRPGDNELTEALDFVNSKVSAEMFEQIWVRVKPSEVWLMDPSEVRDYDSSEIDPEDDQPVMDWLQK